MFRSYTTPGTRGDLRDICEEYCARGRVNLDVIQRIELSAVEIIEKHSVIEWRARVNSDQTWGKLAQACSNQKEISSENRSAIGDLYIVAKR
jgi:hypothetical protein